MYKSVSTLSGTSYQLGEFLAENKKVTDITLDFLSGENLCVLVWTTTGGNESIRVIIPYHAVELLVKS